MLRKQVLIASNLRLGRRGDRSREGFSSATSSEQTTSLLAILLAVARETSAGLDPDQKGRTHLDQAVIELLPAVYCRGSETAEEDADLSQGSGETQPGNRDGVLSSRIQHDLSDQANGNQVNQQFLLEGLRGTAMPMGGPQSVLEVPEEGLHAPAQMIEVGEFLSRKSEGIQQGSDQASAMESFSLEIEHAYRQSLVL